MLKGLALAAAIGAVALVAAVATGRADYLRSELDALRRPFNDVSAALSPVVERERAWDTLTKKADSICARYEEDELVIRPALPRNRRADYVRAIESALERERAMQAELAELQPPSNYKILYTSFLQNRDAALAELEHLQKAAKEKIREAYVLAASGLAQRKGLIDRYAAAAGMPACEFRATVKIASGGA
jgi:hypothetical protein